MTIDGALLSILENDAGVIALVGTRSYALHLPQAPTLPAVTYQKVSAERMHAMSTDPGVVLSRYQFRTWATSMAAAHTALVAVQAAVSRYRGTADSTEILDALFDNELDVFDDDAKLYTALADAMVAYRE